MDTRSDQERFEQELREIADNVTEEEGDTDEPEDYFEGLDYEDN